MQAMREFEEELGQTAVGAKGGKTMRIMVPVDGTAECEEAVPMAARLAEGFGAEVYLVRVVEAIDAFSPLRYEQEITTMVKEARGYLYDLAYRWELPGERTQCLVAHTDDHAKELVELARAHEIDLIVMTTHGRKGIRRWTQGSGCDALVRAKVCPVIVIPPVGPEETGGHGARWYERLPVPVRAEREGELVTR